MKPVKWKQVLAFQFLTSRNKWADPLDWANLHTDAVCEEFLRAVTWELPR